MSDLNTEIKITASADGVETGVARAKRSLAGLKEEATRSGAEAGRGMAPLGDGAEAAARKVDSATRSMQNSLQRQIAALEAGGTATRQYQESLAKLRGVDANALKPLLDQLDAAKAKADRAGQGLNGLGTASSFLQGQLAALAGSLTLGSMAAFVLQINNGIDALNDIKDATGSTIENISALEDIGKRTGASLDLVGGVLIKFNDVLSKATPKSDIALQLQAIGLSAEELKRIDPAEALLKTAQALSQYADDGNKARLIQDLFGKSVKDAAPFLADLAEKGQLVAKVTAEQADEADRFNKQLFEMQANIQEASRRLAGPLVSAINEVAKAFREGSASGKGFFEIASDRYWSNVRGFYNGEGVMSGSRPVRNPREATGTIRVEAGAAATEPPKPSIVLGPTAAEIAEQERRERERQSKAEAAARAAAALREREFKEQQKFFADLAGLSGDYYDKLAQAQKERAAGNITEAQYIEYVEQLIQKQPFATALTRDNAAAIKAQAAAAIEAAKASAAYYGAIGQDLARLEEQNQRLREEGEQIGLSAQGLLALTLARQDHAIAIEAERLALLQANEGSAGEILLQERRIALLKEQRALTAANGQRQIATDAAKEAATAWQRASDDIERSLTDALMRGFESGKGFAEVLRDTVANMFKTLVLRPIVSAVVSPVAGAITGSLGLPGAANAASGISSLATGASALSGFGAFGSGVSSGLSAWGAGGSVTGLLSSGSSLFAGGVANGLGTLTGALGPVALGLGVLAAISKATKGENRFGGAYELTGTGVERIGGAIATNTQSDISAITAAIGQTNNLLETLGSQSRVATYGAFVETSGKGRGGIFAGGNLSTGQRFGTDSDTRQYTSGNAEEQAARFAQELQQTTLLALKAATDIPKGVQQMLSATNIDSLNLDQATALLAQIANYPNTLLSQAGTTRDALVQTFTQGLQAGDAAAAGQAVADQLVTSIQQSMLGNAAGQIFDIVNRGIVTPVIDAMLAGQSVTEALSQAGLDAVISQATAKAQALGAVFNDPAFAAALATLRTNVGSALGTAGAAVAYAPAPPVVPAPAALAAVSSASSVGDAVVDLAQVFADARASMVDTQRTLGIDLQRALGDEAGARAAERAAYLAGFAQLGQAEQDRLGVLYDQTQALRDQITAIDKAKEAARQLTADMQALATAADSSAAKFLSGDALASFQTGRIAEQLNAATGSSLTGANLAALGIDQIRQAVLAFVASDAAPAAKTAVLQLGSSLVDLKTAAADAQRTTAFALADATFAGVERAAAAQRKLLETSRAAADKLRQEVQGVFDTLQSSVDDLFGSVDSTKNWQATQGQQFIAAALAAARATGALPDGKDLTRAITAARGGLDADQFRTQAEADFARLVLANELRDLQDISGNQLTEAERQAKAAEDALTALDASLETARDQLNELKGINTGVSVTMPAALAAFAASLAAARPFAQTLTSSTGGSYSMATGIGTTASGQKWDRATVASAAADLLNAQGATAVYNAIKTSGYTLAQAEKIFGSPAGSLEEEARKMGLPVFHEGTSFVPKTGFALLEKGEAVIPAAYNPMANPGYTGGNLAELLAELRLLREQNARLEDRLQAIEDHTGQFSDQFDRVSANGNNLSVEFLTPQKVEVAA